MSTATATAVHHEAFLDVIGASPRLVRVVVPGGAVNFTFVGPGRNVLLTTANEAIWAALLNSTGPRP